MRRRIHCWRGRIELHGSIRRSSRHSRSTICSLNTGEVSMFVPLTPMRCLHRAVDLFGKKIGVVSGAKQFTYAQFGERCEKLATALAKEGIRHGDRACTTPKYPSSNWWLLK